MKHPIATLVVVLLAGFTASCATSPAVRSVTHAIEDQIPGIDLEREVHLRFGRVGLGLTRLLVRIAGDDLDSEEAAILASLSSLEISVYRVRGDGDYADLRPFAEIEEKLLARGWSNMVTTRDNAEMVKLMVRENRAGELREMFVASLDHDELALVRLKGDLDRVLAEAIADDPGSVVVLASDRS